jgi:hypothetical protein
VSGSDPAQPAEPRPSGKSDPWTNLALTLPIFVLYHLGVVFLPFRNAADLLTSQLHALARHSLPTYAALTLAIGAVFAVILRTSGRKQALEPKHFLRVCLEGALYAAVMRAAGGYVVGSLRLAGSSGDAPGEGTLPSVVMALGAGFYEEVAFRVALFGAGALLLRKLLGLQGLGASFVTAAWGVAGALAFSYWHYTGDLGEQMEASSFVFRAVCGLVLTAIFAFRGFAPAVWTHALYDVWVMVIE